MADIEVKKIESQNGEEEGEKQNAKPKPSSRSVGIPGTDISVAVGDVSIKVDKVKKAEEETDPSGSQTPSRRPEKTIHPEELFDVPNQASPSERAKKNQQTTNQDSASSPVKHPTSQNIGSPVTIPNVQKEATDDDEVNPDPDEQEQDWSQALSGQRVQQFRQAKKMSGAITRMVTNLENPELDMADNQNLAYLKKMQHSLTSGSKVNAIKTGAEIGLDLRHRIAAGSMQGFLFALSLAIIKDFWDFGTIWFTVGIAGTLFNIMITTALLFVVMFQGIWFRRWLLKKMWGRFLGAMVMEFIPILNFFPWWIISVLLVKQAADKRQKKQQAASDQHDENMENLKAAEDDSGEQTNYTQAA